MPTDPKQRATTVKNRDNTEFSVAYYTGKMNKLKTIKMILAMKKEAPISIPIDNTNNNKSSKRAEREPKTIYPPCETCGKTNHSTKKCYYGANAANRLPP